ncbi:hypothetical protein ACEPAF_8756 [Sanghuangporus sanghuang]
MHKDLNAVKGGDSAMQEEWKKFDISPILLANRDNSAVLELAECDGEDPGDERDETAAEKRAREVSKAGGVKLSYLIGLLVNDKDDKKGWHHIFQDWASKHIGLTFTFPNTSNTRYSSYLDAAAEILVHLDAYVQFMDRVRYSKVKPSLNNLEENISNALNDPPTLTELACLALYQEAVSIPYISSIRGDSLEEVNALELGSRLRDVQSHIKRLIEAPQTILRQAQIEDAEGTDRKRHREIEDEREADYTAKRQKCEIRKKRREETDARIDAVELQLDRDTIEEMTVAQMKDQLAKLCKMRSNVPIPKAKDMPKKEDIKRALLNLLTIMRPNPSS